ncbi:uncharacterized protein LOC124365213 isoform X4 [Homalodisca vitripennis]|uniref:uncharacterized protein LOC124365213 isoform X4 n=1 Tax=Homalodisca vitripennis TaxID=197043 RepID=UPI001EEC8FDB|nr:uncharacterized protein LOC124365213 isoform X4 [Homalodisca vitripennis]
MVDKLTTKCCWFFSLPVGSFLIGCYIVVSNFLGTVYLLDEADDRNLDWKFQLSYAIYGSAFISGVLLIIGIVILIGLFWIQDRPGSFNLVLDMFRDPDGFSCDDGYGKFIYCDVPYYVVLLLRVYGALELLPGRSGA